jgi:FHA domain
VTAITFASAVSTFRLEQVGGPELATPSLLLGEKLLLGRGTDCTLVLPDAAVSRRHALIELRGTQYWLTDLESRAGTFLHDLRLDAKLAASHSHWCVALSRARQQQPDAHGGKPGRGQRY